MQHLEADALATNAQIIEAIRQSRGLIAVAARELGIERTTIFRRMQRCEKVREAVEDEREFRRLG